MACNSGRPDSNEVYLEIPKELQSAAWQHSQSNLTKANQWQGYLNYLCLEVSLDWFAKVMSDRVVQVEHSRSKLSHLWELVNGMAIEIDRHRLCLLPHTTCDRSELRVPCEWVDIPDWVADYYLAVQIDPDTPAATIWSYTTHRQLQQLGMYDDLDRTYCLDADDLIQDLSILPLALRSSRAELTRASVTTLDRPNPLAADRYLHIWSQDDVAVPRLDLREADFPHWLALIADDNWRQALYEQRLGLTTPLVTSNF